MSIRNLDAVLRPRSLAVIGASERPGSLVPAVDIDAVVRALTRVSELLLDCPTIIELDINPLLARAAGIVALDARIRIGARASSALV